MGNWGGERVTACLNWLGENYFWASRQSFQSSLSILESQRNNRLFKKDLKRLSETYLGFKRCYRMSQLLKGNWSIKKYALKLDKSIHFWGLYDQFSISQNVIVARKLTSPQSFPRFLWRWNYRLLLVPSPEPSFNHLPQVVVEMGFKLSR